MPIITRWLVEKRVIVTDMIGEISEADTRQLAKEIEDFVNAGTPPVHTLTILEALDKPFDNLDSLKSTLTIFKDPRIGWSVAYGSMNPLVEVISNSLIEVLGLNS
jgi:hypothetical protein